VPRSGKKKTSAPVPFTFPALRERMDRREFATPDLCKRRESAPHDFLLGQLVAIIRRRDDRINHANSER